MPNFDSREFEYADVKVVIFGRELSGLRGLTYKKSYDKEHVFGQGNEPKAIQRGQKTYEGSLMVLKSDYDDLCSAAKIAGYDDLTDVPGSLINITCTYQKEGSTTIKTDSLIGVEFTEAEDGMQQSDKFKELTLPFLFMKLKKQ